MHKQIYEAKGLQPLLDWIATNEKKLNKIMLILQKKPKNPAILRKAKVIERNLQKVKMEIK